MTEKLSLVMKKTRFKQHMNLPGTANMTYDFVKDFFDDYKKLISKIIFAFDMQYSKVYRRQNL